MPDNSFRQTQMAFAAHIRNPALNPKPEDIEDRRMAIYRDLFYNNIENFIANSFPVLRSMVADQQWHDMVRDFVHRHKSSSPYFLEISQEFLGYLQHEREMQGWEPPFMLELAHYEWVELALDVSVEQFPRDITEKGDLLSDRPVVSPLCWSLSYNYPVHTASAAHYPGAQPTWLLVYRNRQDEVGFLEVNAVTQRLLQLLEQGEMTGESVILELGRELGRDDPASLVDFGLSLLEKLHRVDIICGFYPD